jgi:hypothetical protein
MGKIVVLINDAGGAELFAAMIKCEKKYEWTVVTPADSPAYLIFVRENLKNILEVPKPFKLSGNYLNNLGGEYLFFNPGWSPYAKYISESLKDCRQIKIALMDHWIDYRERFGYPNKQWKEFLPDITAVSDSKAYQLASNCQLPEIKKIKNYYLSDIKEQFTTGCKNELDSHSETALFLSQSVTDKNMNKQYKGNFSYTGFFEKNTLEFIVKNFDILKKKGIRKIKIRLHPSETKFKYENVFYQKNVPFAVEWAKDYPLQKSIAESALVMGLNSMALFIAHICGMPILSILLNKGIPNNLPIPSNLCIRSSAQFRKISFEIIKNQQCVLDLYKEQSLDRFFETIRS